MDYKNVTRESIEEAFMSIGFFKPKEKEKAIRVYTGVGGADNFDEGMENGTGFKRVYIGIKVPRFYRSKTKAAIKKSRRGKYYKLIIAK